MGKTSTSKTTPTASSSLKNNKGQSGVRKQQKRGREVAAFQEKANAKAAASAAHLFEDDSDASASDSENYFEEYAKNGKNDVFDQQSDENDDNSSISSGEGVLRQYNDEDGLDESSDDEDKLDAGLQQEQLIEQLLSRRVDEHEYASSSDDDDDADDDDANESDDDEDSDAEGGDKLMHYLRTTVFDGEKDRDDAEDDDEMQDAAGDEDDASALLRNENRYLQKSLKPKGSTSAQVDLKDLLASLQQDGAGQAAAAEKRITKGEDMLATRENIASLKKIVKEKERGDIHRELADDQSAVEERRAAFDLVDAHMEKWHPVVNSLDEARRLPLRYKEGARESQKGALQQQKPKVLDAFDHELEVKIEKQKQRKEAAVAAAAASGDQIELNRPTDLFGFVETTKNAKKMSKKDLMEKAAEIRRRRFAMQEEQRKFAHLKKIKSKSYRRILKKEREKEDQKKMESEMEHMDSEELQERLLKEERALLKERMTLKHKNQSGWIRRALKVAHEHQNKDLHIAISEQLKKGEDLRKRQTGTLHDDSDEEDEIVEQIFKDGSGDQARELLTNMKQEILNRSKEDNAAEQKGLQGMEFMRKARERKREQQCELLDQMEREILGKNANGEEESKPMGRRVFTSVASAAAGAAPMNAPILLASAVKNPQFDAATAVAATSSTAGSAPVATAAKPVVTVTKVSTGSAITIQLNNEGSVASKKAASAPAASKPVLEVVDVASATAAPAPVASTTGRKRRQKPSEEEQESQDQEESNPWLSQSDQVFKEDRASKRQKKDKEQNETEIKVAVAELMRDEEEPTQVISKESAGAAGTETDKLKQFMQSVKKQAFAEDDVELEFGTEKQRTIDMEVDLPELASSVKPGWGDWAGKGTDYKEKHEKRLKKIDDVKDKLRKKKAQERPDRDKKHVIIRESAALPDKYINKNVAGAAEAVRQIYDTATAHPLGSEWNSYMGTRRNIRPRVEVKHGSIVAPLKYKDAYLSTKKHHEMEQKALHGVKDEREDPMQAEADRIRKNYEEVKLDRMRARDSHDKEKFDRIREKQKREEREKLII